MGPRILVTGKGQYLICAVALAVAASGWAQNMDEARRISLTCSRLIPITIPRGSSVVPG